MSFDEKTNFTVKLLYKTSLLLSLFPLIYFQDNVHLILSDKLIKINEKERWKQLTENVDFTKKVNFTSFVSLNCFIAIIVKRNLLYNHYTSLSTFFIAKR